MGIQLDARMHRSRYVHDQIMLPSICLTLPDFATVLKARIKAHENIITNTQQMMHF